MSHESVIASLKALIKHDLLAVPVSEHNEHLARESDRTVIILSAAMVERFVLVVLTRLMSSANSDERNRIFNFEGPCGSFANRIRLAHALGVFSRQTKREIDLVKEMRNVAAHCVAPLSFDTPEIREAVALLMPTKYRTQILALERTSIKNVFDRCCARLNTEIISPEDSISYDEVMRRALGGDEPETLP